MMERHNRKSHLSFPSISPASKAILRGESDAYNTTITPSREKRRAEKANKEVMAAAPTTTGGVGERTANSMADTPTTGDIPIRRDASSSFSGRPVPAAVRPTYPTRTSSASQVAQHISHGSSGSARALDLPIRPAPQLVGMPPRASSRRPDTAGSNGRPDTASSERSVNSSIEQGYANARRPLARSGFSDPRLGGAYSEARLSAGYSSVPGSRDGYGHSASGSRDGYNRSPDPSLQEESRGNASSGRSYRGGPPASVDQSSRGIYDRF